MRSEIMDLIILGNGFDIASNLPTKYNNYFSFREVQLDILTEHLLSFIDKNKTVVLKTGDEYVRGEERDISRKIKKVLFELNIDFNFWDLFFIVVRLNERGSISNKNSVEWNSVEEQILSFVMSFEFEGYNNNSEKLSIYNIKNFKYKNVLIADDQQPKISLSKFSIIILYEYLSHMLNYNFEINRIHSFLLKELIKFEDNFREYITNIMTIVNDPTLGKQKKYRNNLLKLIRKDSTEDIFVLSFNYTSVGSKYDEKSNTSVPDTVITIDRAETHYKVTTNNVHGVYNKVSIFGIDQSSISADDSAYIFTKTYRKISHQEDLVQLSLPPYKQNMKINFYGHSLAKADYSYFQSIFDIYDIYHNNVKLVFSYSVYGDDSETNDTIRHNYYKNITKLLREYGNTMINKNHGNNLIHKMLLENRLELNEVVLDEVLTTFESKNIITPLKEFKINNIKLSNIKDIDKKRILSRVSKNYGEKGKYDLSTWYTISFDIIYNQYYDYYSFEVRDLNNFFTFSSTEILEKIEQIIDASQELKNMKNNRLNIEIRRSSLDHEYYITRFGSNLINPIKIENQ